MENNILNPYVTEVFTFLKIFVQKNKYTSFQDNSVLFCIIIPFETKLFRGQEEYNTIRLLSCTFVIINFTYISCCSTLSFRQVLKSFGFASEENDSKILKNTHKILVS